MTHTLGAPMQCGLCGETFPRRNGGQRWCSPACREAAKAPRRAGPTARISPDSTNPQGDPTLLPLRLEYLLSVERKGRTTGALGTPAWRVMQAEKVTS